MKRKGFWLTGLVIAGLLAVSPPANAGVRGGIRIGPPPPRREVVVARPGHVWVRGYWGWGRDRYVWRPGRWIAERPGWVWMDGGWGHRRDGWEHREGYWRRR
jgi:hypothetical protein